jgi:aminoglycoside 6'-N-acetyltransferase I
MMKIIDLTSTYITQLAQIVVEGFLGVTTAWKTLDLALEEVQDSLEDDRISRIAIDETDTVIGWIGGIKQYDGHAYELHPLVVHPAWRKKGIGRLLVEDLEKQVVLRGAKTLYLGTDDEMGLTSLAGVDVYPNVLDKLRAIQNLKNHPFGFYRKMGFEIVGMIPDANGFGKPDLFMAKRLG